MKSFKYLLIVCSIMVVSICLAQGTGTSGNNNYEVNTNTPTVKSSSLTDPCEGLSLNPNVYSATNGKCMKDGKEIKVDTPILCADGTIKCRPALTPQDIKPYVQSYELPCQAIGGGVCKDSSTPAGLISRIYQFGLMAIGLLAFGAFMFGALKYILSAGNIGNQQDAKDWMYNAIYGLILFLGAWLILYTINPKLVNLKNPGGEPININNVGGSNVNVSEVNSNTPVTNPSLTPAEIEALQNAANNKK